MSADTFLGFGNTEWAGVSAIASGIYDVLTFLLILFAAMQIFYARREAQINRTLTACDKYDLDPVLDAVCRRLATARDNGELEANPQSHRVDIYSVLNYLEGIAIGVKAKLYCGKTVRAQLESILISYVQEYIETDLVYRAGVLGVGKPITGADYEHMRALVKHWAHVPWYRRILRGRKTKDLTTAS
jgi:hypothetical protein